MGATFCVDHNFEYSQKNRLFLRIHFLKFFFDLNFTFPTVIYNRGKVLESARENSKISSCFVLWEP